MKRIDNDSNGNPRFQLGVELVSMGDTVLTNTNGKNYIVATVKFTDVKQRIQTVSAIVYEGNYAHKDANFQVGSKYLATAVVTKRDGKPSVIMQMSHLVYNGEVATADMFEEVEDSVAQVVSTIPNTHKELQS